MSKLLSDEEFQKLQEDYTAQLTLREEEAQRRQKEFLKPLQEFGHGPDIENLRSKVYAFLADTGMQENRNIRLAFEQLRGAIDNLAASIPVASGE